MAKDDIPAGLKTAFKQLDKMNRYGSILSENALSIVKDYIDTGSMAFNAIISGSLFKGVAKGRITGLVGPTGSGKTLMLSKIIANAQKKDPDIWGIVWDSENAYDRSMAINVGANPKKIRVNPVATVEDCRNEIVALLDSIVDDESLHGKIVIGIDSLGNLASSKEIADAEKGKNAVDMGARAKAIKSMMRVLTMKCAFTDTTLIFTNHIYDDPACMFPSLVKNQAGGKGPMYLASTLVQLAVTQEKDESGDKNEIVPIANRVKGVNLRGLTVKNRFAIEMLQTSMYMNYKTGLYKYSGLLEFAEGFGVVYKEGNTYYNTKTKEKLGMKKAWKDDAKVWDKILPDLDVILQKELAFSNETENTELEQEVQDLVDEEIVEDEKNI